MKKLNKLLLLFLSLLLIFSLAIGCSAKESKSFDSAVTENSNSGEFDTPREENFKSEDSSPLEPEKVITTINMYLKPRNLKKPIKV